MLDLDEPVKLVIWDLDDTLWEGTLSEGAVVLHPGRSELVRGLNRRGIVNSICSKNDADLARARLVEADLWDEFVFARIDWTPKGSRVAQLVADIQLRPENVLFIDDSVLNREEVRHAVPGICTASPDAIEGLLNHPACAGKADTSLSRLQQYCLLEQKLVDRQVAPASNEEFLRSCDIRIQVLEDAPFQEEAERCFELVQRTNQLNFTKRRHSRDEFAALLVDPAHRVGRVRVQDRYGDYGVCGFFAVRRHDAALVDFLFSCRILNMGVEQWLYVHLGRPSFEVVGDVASDLAGSVDWITLEDSLGGDDHADLAMLPTSGGKSHWGRARGVLMVGGCDLITVQQFLGGTIDTHLSHVGPTGAFIFTGHTETLRQSQTGISPTERAVVDRIPFLDQGVFRSPAVVSPEYDVLIYSVLTDYTQGLYRHRTSGLVVPWLRFDLDATDHRQWSKLEVRYAREQMDRDFFEWFAAEFEFIGGITLDRFQANIRWLADTIPPGSQLILLNGAEVALDNEREAGRHLHHRRMNEALDEVVRELPHAAVCDVRHIVRSPDDLLADIRHYRRHVYLQIAERVRAIAVQELHVKQPHLSTRAYEELRKFAGRRKLELRRLRRRLRDRQPTRPA